ncbi:Raffinose synthase or seed imbibition protein Sip1 [Musa troglodytarum]|uniref:galactinol--sucrose galactosyltransferase n=2 Tax=Musa troglodytarum TaxID=320322 RepID=A0A9E7FEZ6_9LILI|nr:Raffinose synthase or seed imbibition protein Sip1 [Musa troglodytarum]
MTVTPGITVSDGNLVVCGKTILTDVPDNIVLTSGTGAGLMAGAFIGAAASDSKSLHVFPMGTLRGLRFMCCFRFKLWWMTQRMGTCGRDVPLETQFLLVEGKDAEASTVYTVFLPLLDGPFRAVLQGNYKDEIEICLESGDEEVETKQGMHMVYMHAGANPFEVISQAVKVVEKHLQTFHHREKKKLPSFVDWFGWCTWDAFYTDVTAEGVDQGLRSLAEGGAPPRFLIIDDGWQQIGSEVRDQTAAVVQEGAQFASRLTGIKENAKFQRKQGEGERRSGLRLVVEEVKQRRNVKYVYVWHAMAGYWGGVKPAAQGMEHYESALAYPVQSPGVMGNQPDIVMDSLSSHGLGLVHPKKVYSFYNELHAYLASCGIDGIKVDVQNIIETLGAGHGGRVFLTRAYHQALEASIAHNFLDNGCISCMCHNTDGLYSAKQTAVVRASDDFYPRDPASHTVHISSVAYNTLFLGEFMLPDWDMFHSLHPAAEYHAAARAIGGCPIYVSDKPGHHNFELLRKLVLPDGSILRAQLPGRPTRDCLFCDPARDGTSLLKIWNVNKCSGVVGVFNCQGAGWCKHTKKTRVHDAAPGTLTGTVIATDVDAIAQLTGPDWGGQVVIYAFKSGELIRLPKGATLPVTVKVLEYEVFHVCPVKNITPSISFAPIGLLDMFNSGGAVEQFDVSVTSNHAAAGQDDGRALSDPAATLSTNRGSTATVALRVRGRGRFGAYSSQRPLRCTLDSSDVDFSYDEGTGLVTINIPVPEREMYQWSLQIQV